MAKRRRRRKWSDDEKRMICGQARMPGVSVAQVARRYDVNANQIFNWMKDPRFAADGTTDEDDARFLPVEIVSEAAPVAPAVEAAGVIELELANGHRLRISGGYDPEAVARLARLLS
jgi:transposase